LQQNNFLKGEQDRLSAELAQRTGEIQLVKSNYESTREHMRQQAEQSEERERDVSTLHKDFSRMKKNFKEIQSTQAEMSKKLEYTYGLTPTYLAGLQETRGDVDRLAHNIDQEMQEQKIKDHNARELMERQWVQLLKGSQDEMAQRHHSLCSHIGVVLNGQSEMLKDLQWKQHLMEENERNKLAQRVGNKRTESSPCPSPVDPVHVQPRSRSEPTQGRRI
jgi:chromosome segregation ATPase